MRKKRKYGEAATNALMKIRSIVFNLAQEHRINAAELDDFNEALATAFDGLKELKNTITTNAAFLNTAEKNRNEWIEQYDKMKLIAQLTGLSGKGIEELETYPTDFLKMILMAGQKHNFAVEKDSHFWLIRIQWAWLLRQIEGDRQTLKSARFFKKLHAAAPPNSRQKEMALQIMKQIAEQHPHILEDLQQGKRFHELQTKITNHWYAQLSTHNIATAETR